MKTFRRLTTTLLVAVALCAQTLVVSPAEITGDSATHAVSTNGVARWILFMPLSTNSAACRVGDSNTGASRGVAVAAGGGLFYPPVQGFSGYDLTKNYYYCTTGDKMDILWAK